MNEPKDVVITSRALSLISHKLKTPLSIINGYSEAILSQAKKEKFSKLVRYLLCLLQNSVDFRHGV